MKTINWKINKLDTLETLDIRRNVSQKYTEAGMKTPGADSHMEQTGMLVGNFEF